MSVEKIKVTPELIEALRLLKTDKDWSDYRLAKEFNTTPTSVFRWMNYKAKYIRNEAAELINVIIPPYLEQVHKKRAKEGPQVIPHSLEVVIDKIKLLHGYDPKLLNDISGFLDTTIEFIQKIAPIRDNRKSEPAKLKIKKLSKKALAEKKVEENFYTPVNDVEPLKAAAGNGCIYDYEYSVPEMGARSDIDVINVAGNSMEPLIKEGSRIVVQRFTEPIDFADLFLPEETVKSLVPEGSIVVYNLNDNGLAIKKVRYITHEKDGGPEWSLYLEAVNPEWAEVHNFPKRITMQDRLMIYGKMIGQAQ